MENSSPYEQIFQKSQKNPAPNAAFGPAKPVILRSEPEVKIEDACHRAERGLFLPASCLFDSEYSVFWLFLQILLYGEKFSCSCEDRKKPERIPHKPAWKHSCRQLGFWLFLQISLSGEFFSKGCED